MDPVNSKLSSVGAPLVLAINDSNDNTQNNAGRTTPCRNIVVVAMIAKRLLRLFLGGGVLLGSFSPSLLRQKRCV